MDLDKVKVVHNQPYDESVEVSDGEEITSNNPTPRVLTTDQQDSYTYTQQQPSYAGQTSDVSGEVDGSSRVKGGRMNQMMYDDEDEEEDEEESHDGDSEEEEEQDGQNPIQRTLLGGYDPSDYDHLQIGDEVKDLFQYITRYTPQSISLETRMMPFIPDYVPAIGDIDAFLKVTHPDNKSDNLGLTLLDEPSTKQSDPHVLDLQLRTHAKQSLDKPAPVHSIQDPEKNSKSLDSWIDNIKELHRQKPATNVHYSKNMPDIETLMQEWPTEFEDVLKEIGLPNAELDCDLKQYVDILCALLDIPVHGNRIHSLHVLFSLYMEFKNSQHFNTLGPTIDNSPSKLQ